MSNIHWKSQFKKLPNQSDAHEHVRKILCTDSLFKNLSCYQEVPVAEVCGCSVGGAYRYDWYIQELGVVLEIHGDQHYRPTAWGSGVSYEQKMLSFRAGQGRDRIKRQAAVDAGLRYLEIPYSKIRDLDGQGLRELLETI